MKSLAAGMNMSRPSRYGFKTALHRLKQVVAIAWVLLMFGSGKVPSNLGSNHPVYFLDSSIFRYGNQTADPLFHGPPVGDSLQFLQNPFPKHIWVGIRMVVSQFVATLVTKSN